MVNEVYESISPADFFYRNKEIAGFDNPSRSTYTVVRELVENSLDSCESNKILPKIFVRLRYVDENVLEIRVRDNGGGIPSKYVPQAFGQVFFGSKYRLRQTRGIFGLGGKMAILYGQITANTTVKVYSSTLSSRKTYFFELFIDIGRNRPKILSRKVFNDTEWHGLDVSFRFVGNYEKAKSRIIEYLWETTMAVPYATILFVSPNGELYFFPRRTSEMPDPPREIAPHPYGIDIEMLKRLIRRTLRKSKKNVTLKEFLVKNFQRIGEKTADKFLRYAGFKGTTLLKNLKGGRIVRLALALKSYNGFMAPDASGLSPIGKELFEVGIREATNAEFVHVVQRPPSSYEGHPFIVETAIAYGGDIQPAGQNKVNLYRFANKIPLLYDAHNDVSMRIIRSIDWRVYRIRVSEDPVAFFVHICSTKVPYKTVGKEYIADQPEVAKQIELGIRENARRLAAYLSQKRREAERKHRISIIEKYLRKIAELSAELAGVEDASKIREMVYKEVLAREL